jgi:murein DD-endopeptidase MepM/ murein hydrolase activator NlpD
MVRYLSFYYVFYLLLALTACQRIALDNVEEITPTSERLTSTVKNLNQYPSIEPSTVVPIIPTESKLIPFTITTTYTPTKIPTQTEIPFTMCTPLMNETIPSLWEIITNPYGYPPIGREDLHHGVDFAYYRRGDRLSIEGEIIQSILPGTVAASIQDRLPYGNMVIIETAQTILPKVIINKLNLETGESIYSLYAHMGQSPQVALGDKVSCGQELGTVGLTGYDIVNPHLHLEVRIGPSGTRFTGMAFYDTSASFEEMDNYKRWRTSGDFMPIDPMLIFAEYLSNNNPGFQTPTP